MTCVICLEETLTQSSIELPCGHAYHAVCLLNYAVRGNRLCPMCRTPYAEEADVEEPDDPLLDEWMQEQARLRERERLISHGMRLATDVVRRPPFTRREGRWGGYGCMARPQAVCLAGE